MVLFTSLVSQEKLHPNFRIIRDARSMAVGEPGNKRLTATEVTCTYWDRNNRCCNASDGIAQLSPLMTWRA